MSASCSPRSFRRNASDLHINPGPAAGRAQRGRAASSLARDGARRRRGEKLCRELCNEKQWKEVEQIGTTDFGLTHTDGNRFRVSVFRQRGRYSAVLRLIPRKLLSFEEIGLPDSIKRCSRSRAG
jgi:twitching motility protein PilT